MAVVCQVCGGTEYIIESGFYYCTECNTQTQELREEIYDVTAPDLYTTLQKSNIVKQDKDTSTSKNITWTTWEGYNYILIGLVNELINLGAPPEIKLTAFQLWSAYLSTINIAFISKNKDPLLPKLSAIYKQNDIRIVYKVNFKRKRRLSNTTKTTTSSKSSFETNKKSRSEIIAEKRLTKKNKKTLSKLEYESSTDYETRSTSSGKESSVQIKLDFNEKAEEVVRKRISDKEHFTEHCITPDLDCHKLSVRSLRSPKYFKGAYHLTLTKLYSILYLALLVDNVDIQLGDILRFIREGHLSYLDIKHLLPEEMAVEKKYLKLFHFKQRVFTHTGLRKITAEIAQLIHVDIQCPDLKKLCQRYVLELQLPDKIMEFIEHLLVLAPPKMSFSDKKSTIPNFEARAMAYILFSLKYLLGLDGVTEQELSKLARNLNNLRLDNSSFGEFFVWDDWVEYIECRKLTVAHYHFPTRRKYFPDFDGGTNLFLNFWQDQKSKYSYTEENKKNIHLFTYKKILEKLNSYSDCHKKSTLRISPSLMPFLSYLTDIKDSFSIANVLQKKFSHLLIDFLRFPNKFIANLQSTNPELILKISKCPPKIHINLLMPFTYISSKIDKSKIEVTVDNHHSSKKSKKSKLKNLTESLLKEQICKNAILPDDTTDNNALIFYNAKESYWIHLCGVDKFLTCEQFKNNVEVKLSNNFQWLLKECSSLIEMSTLELYHELIIMEIYFGFVIKSAKLKESKIKKNNCLKILQKKCVYEW